MFRELLRGVSPSGIWARNEVNNRPILEAIAGTFWTWSRIRFAVASRELGSDVIDHIDRGDYTTKRSSVQSLFL